MLHTVFTNIVLLLGVIQGVLFVLISSTKKKLRVRAHLYLSLLILFLSLNNLEAWLNANIIVFGNYYLDHLHTPWYILLAPSLYLFLSEYLGFVKKKIVLNISLLFFIGLTIIKLLFLYYSHSTLPSEFDIQLKYFNEIAETIGFSITIGIFIHSYKMYKQKDNLIHTFKVDNLAWLGIFFKISLGVLLVWVIGLLSLVLFNENIYFLLHASVSFLIYWIAYMGTYKQRLFTERISLRATHKKSYIKTIETLDETKERDENLFDKITHYLEETEAYTNPLLSITMLADTLEINKNKLSNLINQYADTSFPNFINKYRVEKAKTFLKDPVYATYTMSAIGLEAGFNSKSTFFTGFKKSVGVTPKMWQSQNKS